MALRSSADVGFLLLAGRNILGRITTLNDVEEAVLEETTPLGTNVDSYALSSTKWALDQEGFYDTAAGAINEAFALTGERVLVYGLSGNAVGSDFTGVNAVRTTYEKGTARGALHRAKAHYTSNLGPDRGFIAAPLVARTTTGPTSTTTLDSGVDYANQATGSLVAYLAVQALTLDGSTGLQVKVRDSADDITYADLITFTTVTTTQTSERKSIAAAGSPNDIERYIQTQHTFLGTPGANKTATFVVGVSRSLT